MTRNLLRNSVCGLLREGTSLLISVSHLMQDEQYSPPMRYMYSLTENLNMCSQPIRIFLPEIIPSLQKEKLLLYDIFFLQGPWSLLTDLNQPLHRWSRLFRRHIHVWRVPTTSLLSMCIHSALNALKWRFYITIDNPGPQNKSKPWYRGSMCWWGDHSGLDQ